MSWKHFHIYMSLHMRYGGHVTSLLQVNTVSYDWKEEMENKTAVLDDKNYV